MASVAPYEINVVGSEDETFEFTITYVQTSGAAFPWASYTAEYLVNGQAGTVTTDAVSGIAVFTGPTLSPGQYTHACRLTEVSTGKKRLSFDGSVTITKGPF